MKTRIVILMASLFSVLFAAGCAELDDFDGYSLHPPDWSTPGSADNHAAVLIAEGLPESTEDCTRCHGADYMGGSSGVSCFACHAGGPSGHPPDWSTPGSDENHAAALARAGLPSSVEDCTSCHGADYGVPESECFECHRTGGDAGHPESGFVPPSGNNFHGQKVIDAGGTDGCANCHAWEVSGELDFDLGGWSQQPCNTCHSGGRSGHPGSPDPWFNPDTPNAADFHGGAFKNDFARCGECHGRDYAGSWTEVSCDAGCHNPTVVDFHPHGWSGDATIPSTHGYAVRGDAYLLTNCGGCHGADYLGGWAEFGCVGCHAPGVIQVHPDGWVGASANPGTHGNYLAADPSYQDTCEGCHGSDLEGGWSLRDCRPCHNDFYPPGP